MISLDEKVLTSVAKEVSLRPETVRRIIHYVPETFPWSLPEDSRTVDFIPTTEMHDALMDLNDHGNEGVTGWHISKIVRFIRNHLSDQER